TRDRRTRGQHHRGGDLPGSRRSRDDHRDAIRSRGGGSGEHVPVIGRAHTAAAAVAVLLVGSCLAGDSTGTRLPRSDARLLLRADLASTAVATLVVDVTAADIPTPLVFNIPVVQRMATGTITLPAG